MNPDINLFSQVSNAMETGAAIALPISNGFYRSRIYTASTSINPLIVACDPILTLMANLKTIEYPSDRSKFLEDLAHEVRAFEHHARLANYPENIIIAARYALCCLLDETIALTSEWGKDNGWLHNNLLTIFHNENYGGEYFFTIIDSSLEDIAPNLHLIELLYLCLNFGFAGKHRNTEYGESELASITNKLYQTICQYRRISQRSLFVLDPKTKDQPQQEQNYSLTSIPQINTTKLLSFATVFALIISSVIYFSIHLKLRNISKPLYPLTEHSIISKNNGAN
ncbi:type VI secretion system protein ImpK [Gammaproteobacteria bacterium]